MFELYIHTQEISTLFVLQLWECGIEQCKEFASQLETVTFNYEKLSEIHVSNGQSSQG